MARDASKKGSILRHAVLILAASALLAAGLPAAAQPDAAQPAAPAAPAAGAPAAGDATAGEAGFAMCSGCHASFAPTLKGVAGRKIASVEGASYSDALKAKSSDTWTDANLDAFLKDPNTFAPGNMMGVGVPDDKARADIIAYLKTLH